MAWIESLQRAIDYMEENLLEDITIDDIARKANSSGFHFQRTFSLLTDISVGEYLKRRRLTLAADELCRTNAKVIDVALKYGYRTPEAFTKAFRRQHGISPREARKLTGKLKSYNRLTIQVRLKGADPMQYKVANKESFEVIGIKQTFPYANSENLAGIPKMWEKVNRDGTSGVLISKNNGPVKGILGVCVDKNNEEKQMDYWIASASNEEASEELSKLEIPASKWVIFEVHGAMPDAMQSAWKKIFSEWFPSSGYEHAGTPDLEVYTFGDISSPDYYSEIWIPVK
ncbi:AraC family transcriptional regulator [Bacillus badius]|uniref:Transcriptional regulator, AraC family n=1 Tax=Bacillus badius TaxID=1455 RepID=A0ABR5B188_BACBA|nr:AraC family transcriptional regulator [Bacillus badius]KIL80750.1 Transcriptional regulator, AraC family [Bacillus badius]MED4715321.1 AraC family transcriptional regulator [Bacillus badius]